MICKGLNNYETKMSGEIQENFDDESVARAERPAAKARPKQASSPISSSPTIKIPYHMRVWMDVEPGEYDEHSFEVSKTMTKLLRHDGSVVREEDGTVEFKILTPMFASRFESSSYWSIRTRLRHEELSALPGSLLSRDSSLPSSN